MKLSKRTTTESALLIFGLGGVLCAAALVGKLAFAQNSSKDASATSDKKQSSAEPEKKSDKSEATTSDKETAIDEYQRSAQVYYMQRMGKSGWQRGEEIYFLDCWICHNDYTIKADPKAAPTLRDLYKRPKLMSGQPVNDETVTNQIRGGSARMPAFRATLNDKDLADLVTYLREKCCWDENNPPSNPRYRGQ